MGEHKGTGSGGMSSPAGPSIEPRGDPSGDLTVDEVAHQAGVTVRNVRAHQSRGLLPPPVLRGRVGWYGAAHVRRLQLITQLQDEGFNLAAINALLRDSQGHEDPLIALRRRILTLPWVFEEPKEYSRVELMALMKLDPHGGPETPTYVAAREMSLEQGTLTRLGPDRFLVTSPTLLAMCVQMAGVGMPVLAIAELQRTLLSASEQVMDHYVRAFGEHVWARWVGQDQPVGPADDVLKLLEELPAMAVQTLLATFALTFQELSGPALLARLDAEATGQAEQPEA